MQLAHKKNYALTLLSSLTALAWSMPSNAAEQDAMQTAAPEAEAEEAAQSDIVVTGSARAQRRFDVSYAVNSL